MEGNRFTLRREGAKAIHRKAAEAAERLGVFPPMRKAGDDVEHLQFDNEGF